MPLFLRRPAGSSTSELAPLLPPKWAVSAPDDAFEQEADSVAEQVVQRKPASCSCGGTCPKCRQQTESLLQRKGGDSSAPAAFSGPVRSSGQTLDAATRADMETHIGHDFSGVRIHTGAQADRSAQLLNAQAYTFGQDIVFREGNYQPQTSAGRNLLAHELTHVVQQQSAPTLRRRVEGDARHICITPVWAQALTDAELNDQESLLKNYLLALTPQLSNDPDYKTAQQNIEIMEQEERARVMRQAGFGVPVSFGAQPESGAQGEQVVPRPPGLPLEGGYTLQPLSDLPPEIAANIPEGQIITLTPGALVGGGGSNADSLSMGTAGLGGGTWAGMQAVNAALMRYGFAPAGDFAIGLVAIPPANMNPFSPNFNPIDLATPLERAGHTAVYVRQGGQITIVRGYNPQMNTPSSFLNVARNQGDIFTGKMGVPGEITSDVGLFQSTAARTIEYPVTPEVAAQFLESLPDLGPVGPGQPPFYSAPPSKYAETTGTKPGCVGTNCGLWATRQAEAALGGRVGIAGESPIMDVPVPGQASQGKFYGMLGRAQEGAPVADMPGATGPAVPGGMSTGLKVIKWGGRVFLVYSVGKLFYDIWTAPLEKKARVAVVGASGFAGGFAGAAALGLVCGPGALVCSIVTGVVGGILGGLGAGKIADALWDFGESLMGEEDYNEDTEAYGDEQHGRDHWKYNYTEDDYAEDPDVYEDQ